MLSCPGQQHRTAPRIGRDSDDGDLPAQAIEQAGGMGVSVGVHADDGIDGVCEHGHAGCSLHPGAVSGRHRPGWEHQTAHL
jgi:hypothetical protein